MSVRRVAAVLALATSLGCARNAVLEVELGLPADTTRRFAVVQVETGAAEFEDDWLSTGDQPGFELGPSATTARWSVVADGEPETVRVKIRFCTTDDCSAPSDDAAPQRWYELVHPLYVGERTRWRETIPLEDQRTVETVGKCEIEGCIRGGGAGTSFCTLDGAHFCE